MNESQSTSIAAQELLLSAKISLSQWQEDKQPQSPSPFELAAVSWEGKLAGQLAGMVQGRLWLAYESESSGMHGGVLWFSGSFRGQPLALSFWVQGSFDEKGICERWSLAAPVQAGLPPEWQAGESAGVEGRLSWQHAGKGELLLFRAPTAMPET